MIQWAVTEEMALTLEDVLARRTRCLFLDAQETLEIAPKVAALMQEFLQKDEEWKTQELERFSQVAQNYIL